METKRQKLDRQIAETSSQIAAWKHLRDTFDSKIAEIEAARKELDAREAFLRQAYADLDSGALVRAELRLEKLKTNRDRPTVSAGPRSQRERLCDQKSRLEMEMSRLMREFGISPDDVIVGILTKKKK